MNILRNRKFWLSMAIILMVACGLFVSNKVVGQGEVGTGGSADVTLINPAMVIGYVNDIKMGILRIQKKLGMSSIPLEKLDFSWPGESEYGVEPEFEIFNQLGGQIQPVTDSRALQYWEDYTDNFRFVFTLGNKVKGLGSEQTELVAILPKMKKQPCELINHQLNENEIPGILKINLMPHPQEVPEDEVVELRSQYGCVETSEGYFYYHVLLER